MRLELRHEKGTEGGETGKGLGPGITEKSSVVRTLRHGPVYSKFQELKSSLH